MIRVINLLRLLYVIAGIIIVNLDDFSIKFRQRAGNKQYKRT